MVWRFLYGVGGGSFVAMIINQDTEQSAIIGIAAILAFGFGGIIKRLDKG